MKAFKLFKLVRCYYCGKKILGFFAVNRRITESPKDIYGIKVKICKNCDKLLKNNE